MSMLLVLIFRKSNDDNDIDYDHTDDGKPINKIRSLDWKKNGLLDVR